MIYSYIRVSTEKQTVDGQRHAINNFVVQKKWIIDATIELEMSSRKSTKDRRIEELLDGLQKGDTIIVSELSRLGRSIKEVLDIVDRIVKEKGCRLIAIKNNIDVSLDNHLDIGSKVTITLFSMLAELERDFISERTKEGLRSLKAQGIRLGKPVGTIQRSPYDKDQDRIVHLFKLGVPLTTIIETHLKYGKYLSLRNYLIKRGFAESKRKPRPQGKLVPVHEDA